MTSDPEEEIRLVTRARAGDLEAQDALIRAYQSRVAGFVFALTGNADAVEDLAQAVFLKVLRSLGRLHDPARFEAWLFRVARNVCRDHFRRERWRKIFVPFTGAHRELPAAPSSGTSAGEELRLALQKLPEAQRELLALLQENDWSYEELAAVTGTTVSAVKSRLFRARTELRRLLSHD